MCTTQASVIILGKYSTKVYPSPLSADLAMSSSQVMTFSGELGTCVCVRIACSKSKSSNTACHSCLRTGERAINNLQHTAIHFGFTNLVSTSLSIHLCFTSVTCSNSSNWRSFFFFLSLFLLGLFLPPKKGISRYKGRQVAITYLGWSYMSVRLSLASPGWPNRNSLTLPSKSWEIGLILLY